VSPERIERKLAAILAADIAGYSRLMGVDEVGPRDEVTGSVPLGRSSLRQKCCDGFG
jgi:hypothetical protein